MQPGPARGQVDECGRTLELLQGGRISKARDMGQFAQAGHRCPATNAHLVAVEHEPGGYVQRSRGPGRYGQGDKQGRGLTGAGSTVTFCTRMAC